MLKRVISMAVALCLLLTLMPQIVWAEALDGFEWVENVPMQVNPLYASVLDKGELEKKVSVKTYAAEPQSEEYVSRKEAIQQIRDYMKQRVEQFTIYVKNDPKADTSAKGLFEDVFDHTGVPTEGDYLAWHYGGWRASGSSNSTGRRVTYTLAYYDTAEQQAEMDQAVENLLDDLNLDGLTDYEKIRGIYDYMTENIVYDYDHYYNDQDYMLQYTAYAALIHGTSVCQGYANLFYRLALELGVDNRIVVGWGNGGGHAWNIVELGNRYYCLDATWDASWAQAGWDYQYFLRGTGNFGDHVVDTSISDFYNSYDVSATDYSSDVGPGAPEVPEEPEVDYRCGDNLTWSLSDDGVLTISGTGDMWNYHVEYPGWYAYVNQVRSCVIEEGVTNIGDFVFFDCYMLENIQIPDSVSAIGNQAFSYCPGLTSLELPDSVQAIGSYAFENCTSLTSVVIPEGVPFLNYGVFQNCRSLKSVTIPASVETIMAGAFEGCDALTDVYYGGPRSDWDCIRVGVYNDILDNVTVHCSESDSETHQFQGRCGDNLTWSLSDDGVLTISGTGPMWDYMGSDYPEWYWTQQYYPLVKCIIDNGVTSIGASAFFDCNGLKEVEMADSVVFIGAGAFESCEFLTDVEIPDSVTYIGDYAFNYCQRLPAVTIPRGVTSLGRQVFSYCRMMTSVVIHDGVTDIGLGAFAYCDSLQDVYYGGTEQQWNRISIDNHNEDLTGAAIHFGSTDTDDNPGEALAHGICGNKLTWTLSRDGVLTISGTGIMWDYISTYPEWYPYQEQIRACVIENGVADIGDYAFYCHTALESVDIPGSVTAIGTAAFLDTPLTHVVIPQGVTSIGYSAFYECEEMVSVELPDSLNYIDMFAFYGCTGLQQISIPQNVDTIKTAAFQSCTSLTRIDIPEGVTIIEDDAFSECTSLTDVYFAGSKSQWDKINIGWGNDAIRNATVHYGKTSPEPERPDPGTGCGMNEEAITQILWSMKENYPEGMAWTNENSYYWNINNTIGYGCAAFAFILSDEVFGYLPSRKIESGFRIEMLRPGDIIRMNNNTHSAVVLEVYDDYVILAEGNYNSSIHWGRRYTAQEVEQNTTYVYTRYPEHRFVNGVCSECGKTEEIPELQIKQGQCGDNVYWSLSDEGLLTISGTGVMWDYPEEYPGWYRYMSRVRECVIEEGVTSIGAYAFYDCTSLIDVEIPESVTSIGEGAFCRCPLTEVEIPQGVTTLEMGTFYGCTRLTSIVIPDSVTVIMTFAFGDCFALADVYFGGSQAQWEQITMESQNDCLLDANIYFARVEPENIPGDTDGDGKVGTRDMILLRQYLAGWDVDVSADAADINGDGRANALDAILLRQYLAGWDVTIG